MAQEIYHRSNWGNPTETWGNVYLNADLTNELYKRASEYENSWVTDQLLNGVGTKPSIILTPTAYEDGILNSVKPAKTLGSELVTNGSFDTDLSGWTNSNNHWQWTSQGAYFPLISTHNPLTQILTNPVGVKLKITFTLNIIQGTANFYYYNINNLILAEQYTESGTYTIETELVKQNTNINFSRYGGINTEFYLDNVSVKEVTEADFDFTRGSSATRVNEQGLVEDVQILSGELVQNGDFEQIGSELVTNGDFSDGTNDWTFGTDITIENEKAFFNDSAYPQAIEQTNVVTIGKQYKVSFTVSDYQSGTVKLRHPFEVSGVQSDGDYVFYGEAASTGITLRGDGIPNNFKIDNVSVKEVGQNWEFFGEAEFTENGARIYSSDGSNSYVGQLSILTNTKKYRLSYEITDSTTGSLKLINVNGQSNYAIPSTVGTHTLDFIANNSNFYILRTVGATDVTIDNISVVEITDDTDLPRINYTNFDYENGEVVPYSGEGSLLLEPQSTNLITYSEELTTDWTRSSISTPTDADTNAPDGTLTVKRLQTTNSDGSIAFTYNTSFNQVSGTTYTVSVYAKSFNGTDQLFGLFGNGSGSSNAHSGNLTATSKWQRFTYTFTASNTSTIGICKGNDALAFDILFWGFQVEALSYATSYIPTNGSTVTRLADICNNSGNSDLINSTEGVLYAEISALANDNTYRLMSISDGSSSNRITLGYSNSSNRLLVQVHSSGVSQVDFTYSISDITLYNKIALLYKSNEVTIWVNGVKGTSDTSASMPIGLSEFNLNYTYGLPLYGKVKSLAVFKEALSDTELQKLTTI